MTDAGQAEPSRAPTATRLHLNHEGYHGERVSASQVLSDLHEAATQHGWSVEDLIHAGSHPISLFRRPPPSRAIEPTRLYVSAGIHGDEPAGPLAILKLLREDVWPENAELTLFPCLNPGGLDLSTREDPDGVDLNRDYREPRTPLVRAHLDWFSSQGPFKLALMLHEDWEADGFYLYELAKEAHVSLAEAILEDVSAVCPILSADHVDGWPAKNGVVRPNVKPSERPDWPEALFVFANWADHCCTLEAPSDYPLETRVAALARAVGRALQDVSGTRG